MLVILDSTLKREPLNAFWVKLFNIKDMSDDFARDRDCEAAGRVFVVLARMVDAFILNATQPQPLDQCNGFWLRGASEKVSARFRLFENLYKLKQRYLNFQMNLLKNTNAA